jgi:hypothetical protein
MSRLATCILIALLFLDSPAYCWWENGHRTTARLAAYYLTPTASLRLAAILSVPNNPESIADALARASTWPDEIKKDRPDTASWHYIDIAMQDKKDQIPERCPDHNCVTARIDIFSAQLLNDKSAADPTVDLDALRFLVHFVGDVQQPLHAVSDADLGGNCEPLTETYEKAHNLHALWDGPLVDDVNPDDRLLAADLKKELDSFGEHRLKKMSEGTVDDWAWESHKIAEKVVYERLKIPKAAVLFPANCKVAPEEITGDKITVRQDYVNAMKPVIRLQLERAGVRLARLLNALG